MSLLFSLLAASAGVGDIATAPAPAPRLAMGQNVHVHIDANSLFAKWIADGIENVGQLKTAISGAGATASNTAVPGQTWDDMRLRADDTDAAYRPGKTNVLITGETTNQIYNGLSTVEQTIQKAQQYISARKAAHPDWIILLVGTIPRADLATPELNRAANQKMVEVDTYQKNNLSDMGVHGFADVRAAAPEFFALRADGQTAPFMDSPATCNVYSGQSSPDMVHPINAPRTAFADAIAAGLAQLPASAL